MNISHNVFPILKNLRKLRNKVHLQSGEKANDHDYNSFGLDEIQTMREILYTILTCKEFCKNSTTFEFIQKIYTDNKRN